MHRAKWGPARRLWPDLSCELAPPAAEFAPEIVQHLGEPPICPGKAQAAPVISHLNDLIELCKGGIIAFGHVGNDILGKGTAYCLQGCSLGVNAPSAPGT